MAVRNPTPFEASLEDACERRGRVPARQVSDSRCVATSVPAVPALTDRLSLDNRDTATTSALAVIRSAPIPEAREKVEPSTSLTETSAPAGTGTLRVAVGADRPAELLAKKSSVAVPEAADRLTMRRSVPKFSPFAPGTFATTAS